MALAGTAECGSCLESSAAQAANKERKEEKGERESSTHKKPSGRRRRKREKQKDLEMRRLASLACAALGFVAVMRRTVRRES